MRVLAKHFNEDAELWGLSGLLHDLDLEETRDRLKFHGIKTGEILKEEGAPEAMIALIKSHNAELLSVPPRQSQAEHLLAAAEQITGLIVACALVLPSKKIAEVKADSVVRRMKEKGFAKNVNREAIAECEAAGMALPEFVELSLAAMREIAAELGL